MTKPIGVLGGTFDPVHHGHLRLALEAADRAGLEHVRLIPLHTPPHRDAPVAAPGQRLDMLRLAVEGIDALIPDDCELERGGVSYTIDTLRQIRSALPDRHLCLITGMDAFLRLNTWHDWRAIPETAHIIVVNRPDEESETADPEIATLLADGSTTDASKLQESESGTILRIDVPFLDISSTRLRRMLAEGRDCRFLLPQQTLDYIHQHQLYRRA